MRSPTPTPSMSRRAVLRLVGGAAIVTALTACGADDEPAVPTPDPLLAEEARARSDAADATAAAVGRPDLAVAFGIVAAERTAHADALAAEVARVTPPPSTSVTTAETTAAAEPGPSPTVDELRDALTESSSRAADLARSLSGYRAGLLGSISAACSVHVSAVLA